MRLARLKQIIDAALLQYPHLADKKVIIGEVDSDVKSDRVYGACPTKTNKKLKKPNSFLIYGEFAPEDYF